MNSFRLPLIDTLSNSSTELVSDSSSAHFPSVPTLSKSVAEENACMQKQKQKKPRNFSDNEQQQFEK